MDEYKFIQKYRYNCKDTSIICILKTRQSFSDCKPFSIFLTNYFVSETSPQTEPKSGTNNPGKLEIEEASNSNLRDKEKCPSSPDSPESVKNSTEKTKKLAVGEALPELCQPNAKPVIKAQKCMKKPELPAKPTFINPGTSRGGPLHEIHKPQIISSPTLRQLKADKFGIRGEKRRGQR